MKKLFKKPYLVVIAFWCVIFTSIFFLRGKISGEKFESQKWKTANINSEENWSLRWDMMNDLRNDYQLIGMSKNEIIKLLGEPDNKSESFSQFRYSLGYAHFGIDTGTLIIEFEKDSAKNYIVTRG
ncbi:hypothetical protein [Flavobacterium sp. UBA7663]|uniref:hypothetical protein n=1 Tax=Flavobacterium sp. UBA7663 TaxID=1946557 RepID=UPI0025BE5BB0|nr:hypothetical protein [Flavobacterium sp. UBA7663]